MEYEELTGKGEAEMSAMVRQRVLAACERQARRFAGHERARAIVAPLIAEAPQYRLRMDVR